MFLRPGMLEGYEFTRIGDGDPLGEDDVQNAILQPLAADRGGDRPLDRRRVDGALDGLVSGGADANDVSGGILRLRM